MQNKARSCEEYFDSRENTQVAADSYNQSMSLTFSASQLSSYTSTVILILKQITQL